MSWFYFWSVCSFWSLMFSFWWTLLNLAIVHFLMKKRETRVMGPHLVSQEKGELRYWGVSHILGKGRRALWGCISLLPNSTKRLSIEYSPRDAPYAITWRARCHTYVCQRAPCGPDAISTTWSISCLRSLKPLDCPVFKNWWAWVLVGEVRLNF
jgi:hypothetical protein